jgi:transglutaminase-like putative cysteine protease
MSAAARPPVPLPLARLGVFAVLALFVGLHWSALIDNPPLLRLLAATLMIVGAAVVLAALGALAPSRRWRWPLALLVATLGLVLAALSLGVPARLLAPGGWGELVGDLRLGLDVVGGATYPYTGGGEWSRLAILLGLALALGASAAVAFWPTAAAASARATLGLAILVAAYGTAATLSRPAAPLLQGLLLFVLVAAWLWLPRLAGRNAIAGLAMIAAAGVLALPLSARAVDGEPLLDYTGWNLSSAAPDATEFFSWNHSYGPIGWPRTGRRLLTVRSAAPQYWRTAVLDRFDGFRWLEPLESSPAAPELPSQVEGPTSAGKLDPRWIHTAYFSVDELSSQLVVAAGAPLSVQGLSPTSSSDGGIVPADGDGISSGDSYSVHYYSPEPTAARMRRAAAEPYQPVLRRETSIAVPQRFPGTLEAQVGHQVEVNAVTSRLTVPLRPPAGGDRTQASADRRLLHSPYAAVYRLARGLTGGAATTYDAVEEIRRHLRGAYSYSESPPPRRYPLRAFLFRDREGYCQQFSGAMTLMLRMLGIPSRVAAGFSPGTAVGNHYVVRDFDAHSWVEVYFEGIGWVTFDPTPAASPAASISAGPVRAAPGLPAGRPLNPIVGDGPRVAAAVKRGSDGNRGRGWLLAAGLAVLAAAAAASSALAARRRMALEGRALADAQIAELRRALSRLGRPIAGGMTLQRLERNSAELGRVDLAAYVAKLRAYRYGGGSEPPGAGDRRRLRRELGRRGGRRRALRALRAVPPFGPRPAPSSDG